MTTTTTAVGLAKKIGREHRAAFKNEFGNYPVRGQVGDWDSTGLGVARSEIENTFEEYDHDDAKEAYMCALFDDAHERCCAYCGQPIPWQDKLAVPELSDDAEWDRLAEQHAPGCDWIATRAHRS